MTGRPVRHAFRSFANRRRATNCPPIIISTTLLIAPVYVHFARAKKNNAEPAPKKANVPSRRRKAARREAPAPGLEPIVRWPAEPDTSIALRPIREILFAKPKKSSSSDFAGSCSELIKTALFYLRPSARATRNIANGGPVATVPANRINHVRAGAPATRTTARTINKRAKRTLVKQMYFPCSLRCPSRLSISTTLFKCALFRKLK